MSSLIRTRIVHVGHVKMGGDEPIVVQSMTTSDTMDVEATVRQVKDLADVGCDIVRITAPTIDDALALEKIKNKLIRDNYKIPICADIHFLPPAALIAADFVEKIRINPGNFADRKMFKVREYSNEEYAEEIFRIEEKFLPLLEKLKKFDRALRIGTNHGSLSDRVMNRFGDTPEGMVQSAFEYADICRKHDFHNFVFSMKASNVSIMVQAYRLLVQRQLERGWDYPIHLGVTEAGEGEDARIKSCLGIGTLLAEGIGDTVRVSLTEASVKEIPVARALAATYPKTQKAWPAGVSLKADAKSVSLPLVWQEVDARLESSDLKSLSLRADVYVFKNPKFAEKKSVDEWKLWIRAHFGQPNPKVAVRAEAGFSGAWLQAADLILQKSALNGKSEWADKTLQEIESPGELKSKGFIDPEKTLVRVTPSKRATNELQRLLEVSVCGGAAFLASGFSGILVNGVEPSESLRLGFGILQATRRRMEKTEYIACPSCGRTLFNLEETTARIKSVTSHLKGVKIAVMGCIVNGPGEMADADFGYVGGAPGKVNLYVQKECVERNIESAEAPDRLVDLIKKNGMWMEPTAPAQVVG